MLSNAIAIIYLCYVICYYTVLLRYDKILTIYLCISNYIYHVFLGQQQKSIAIILKLKHIELNRILIILIMEKFDFYLSLLFFTSNYQS